MFLRKRYRGNEIIIFTIISPLNNRYSLFDNIYRNIIRYSKYIGILSIENTSLPRSLFIPVSPLTTDFFFFFTILDLNRAWYSTVDWSSHVWERITICNKLDVLVFIACRGSKNRFSGRMASSSSSNELIRNRVSSNEHIEVVRFFRFKFLHKG